MQEFEPIQPRAPRLRLSDQVVAALESRIVSGDLKPGERLPTEVQLAESMGVSRTVIRDAIRTLASAGLLTVQHGTGIAVAEPSDSHFAQAFTMLLRRSDVTMDDVLRGRAALEVALAGDAAVQGTAADWERMGRDVDAFADAVEAERWQEANEHHLEFHLGIIRALHVPALQMMLLPLHQIIVISSLPPTLGNRRLWEVDLHRPIVDALETGDPQVARQAVQEHFQYIERDDYADFRSLPFRNSPRLAAYQALVRRGGGTPPDR